uniref:Tetratricopeptide repeat protein 7B n=1 Tax=Callorhinchus milii TaxID=7868 RepID=A0A4W3K5R9_CALMI
MAAKKSGSRLETEIERCRNECLWERIPELIKQLSLLLGEAKLEHYLKENPIKPDSSPQGPRMKLIEVKKHLTAALDRGNLKLEFIQEANLILAKFHYVEGDYSEALSLYSKVVLDNMQLMAVPVYRLRIMAEAYATKGELCFTVISDTWLMCVCSVCCWLAGQVLNTNIQNRSPKPDDVYRSENLTRGVGRFREILRAVETRTTQNLRMTIARQLAEILLRGMCEQSYWNPLEDPPQHSPLDDPSQQCCNLKPRAITRKPRVYVGDSIFCPQENTEEALLLLLISESMANRDAVLSRIPEHNSDRLVSLQSASIVYDLLTIALGRRGQYEMLSECLERAMKFTFEEFHLWYQFALSLMAAGKSTRAVRVLRECIRLKPDDPTIPLLASKLCIGPLHWLEEGERFAEMVTDMSEKASEFRAKGYLAVGLAYSLQATDATLRGVQESLQKKALGAFQRAHSLSPTDHLAAFYLSLQLAISRQIPEALGYVRQALQLQGDDVNSLHLLALLLSAQKHYHDAVNIIDMALSEYPENFILLFTKVKLESMCRGPDEALLTCKHMLQIWKSCYNLTNPSDSGRGSSLLDRVIADRRNLNTITLPDFSDPETGSIHATSIAASRVEQALSEVASSLQSSMPRQGPMHPWMTLAQIWLHAAEVYIGIGKPAEATACIQEAANLFPTSHNVLFMRGQVAELRGNIEEAKRWYEEALSISPTHVRTMQRLGLVLHQLGRYSLAEKVLRDAVQVNSTAHEVWNNLGEVLQAQGNHHAATECFLTALELEASSPVVPFTIIPRTL